MLLGPQSRGERQRSSLPAVCHAAILPHVRRHWHCHLHEEKWHQFQHQPRYLHNMNKGLLFNVLCELHQWWHFLFPLYFSAVFLKATQQSILIQENSDWWCSFILVLVLCLPLEMVCDPLGDYNVWASTRPLNNTAKGHKMWESVVIAAARVSSRKRVLFLLNLSKSDKIGPGQHFTTVQHLLWVHEKRFSANFCSDLTYFGSFPVQELSPR